MEGRGSRGAVRTLVGDSSASILTTGVACFFDARDRGSAEAESDCEPPLEDWGGCLVSVIVCFMCGRCGCLLKYVERLGVRK